MMAEMKGRSILVTRPRHQAQQLLSELGQLGATALELPVIEIQSVELTPADKQKIMDLDRYDVLILVSVNAVNLGIPQIDQYWPQIPPHIHWYAVGRATADALATFGIVAQISDKGADSEALLALPTLQQLSGQRVLLLKGMGGRELMAQTLQARGAVVESVSLYRREKIVYHKAQILQRLGEQLPDIIVVTSVAILESMHAQLLPCYRNLFGVNLVVASKRIAQAAKKLGYQNVVIANGASDQAVIDALNVIA
ncbi:MAG: uroporphyrinogen-III synthase [Pseudomonadales bacterium]|nr:uroporphyrinogen-III synthase [Pseudomonadales bacterium]